MVCYLLAGKRICLVTGIHSDGIVSSDIHQFDGSSRYANLPLGVLHLRLRISHHQFPLQHRGREYRPASSGSVSSHFESGTSHTD